jgi:hypothetical protein
VTGKMTEENNNTATTPTRDPRIDRTFQTLLRAVAAEHLDDSDKWIAAHAALDLYFASLQQWIEHFAAVGPMKLLGQVESIDSVMQGHEIAFKERSQYIFEVLLKDKEIQAERQLEMEEQK